MSRTNRHRDPADSIDVVLERLTRTRPQQLFDAFAENELALGADVAFVAEVALGRDREAVGDITVGDELAEHIGREPIHPVLLDLCTGIAGAALFAAAEARRRCGSVLAAAVWTGGIA